MKTKKELIEMKTQLKLLLPDIEKLKSHYKPGSKFFGMFGTGDMFEWSQARILIENTRNEIKMIDWILEGDKYFGYKSYIFASRRESVNVKLKRIRFANEVETVGEEK